ncbi:FeoA family protein [Olsenella profusa]|uniref:Ferrous iron transport protein A n=1 Tax=Olsenella profusa TaxID=138595 RepID=A0ABS2F1Z3_9ACTN|nr:FeoA family protein [Olsenella profusa]MBM6775006.1 ferrous iron transport protein A [Olsenella profusa]
MASAARLPLAMVGEGETACVAQVRGDAETRQHLANLGFVEGSAVKVVSRAAGDVIVSVKGARLALNRAMASRISVTLG